MVGASVGGGFSVLAAGDNNIGNVDVLTIAAGDNNIGNVDIASALPAGTNAIGTLAANSGVDIGDVDILSIAAGDNNIGNVDIVTLPALAAGTNAIGKLAANSGVDIGDVDILSIAAGDNNIGNVDIVTLPALVAGAAIIGTVGIDQTTPGTTNRVDIGAALPAGTNAIGKLAANNGVDIGDVDILSIAAGDNNIGNVDIVTLPALAAGTNTIGKLAANSGVDIGDVDILSIAAGTNLIGRVGNIGTTSGLVDTDNSSTTSEECVPARATRKHCIIKNNDASIIQYVGAINPATSSHFPIKAGESMEWHSVEAVYIIAASGTPSYSTVDFYY